MVFVRTVSGWSALGRMDRSIVGGWIYSKPIGWVVCLLADRCQLEVWMVGQWLACRLVCLLNLVCRSVEPSGWLAIPPTTISPATHTFIYSTADQPIKDGSFIIISDHCLNFRYQGPTYPRFRSFG